VFAQSPSKRPLIAAHVGGSKTGTDYVEGPDYAFEVRYADGIVSRIPPQIEELVRLKPDINRSQAR
jgi:hypothetical protein